MLTEWYNNGIAEAFIVYIFSTRSNIFEDFDFKKEFENLKNNKRGEFEKFLDENKEVPLSNIKIKTKEKQLDNIKRIFPRASSTQRVIYNKGIWEGIGFKSDKKNEQCSLCGNSGIKLNTQLIFPFERKLLNFFSKHQESARLKLCTFCQKICFYSFGNIFYNFNKPKDSKVGRVSIFFPSSSDYEKIAVLSQKLKQIRITNIEQDSFRNIKPEGIVTFYPFEFLYPCLFALYKWLENKTEDRNNIENILTDIKIELISYISGNLDIFDSYNSISRIDKIFKIFDKINHNVKEINVKRKEKGQELSKIGTKDVFNMFFNSLTIDAKKFEDKNRLRELFTKILLKKHKVDYITLNEIVMQNIKRKEGRKFISFYELMIKSILEGLNMDEEKTLFERINTSGYVIGAKAKEDLGESALWDVFRTRTPGDFYDSVVKTQLKLRMSFDTREIAKYTIEDTSRWREIKAIFLNGMANALFGQEKSK